MKLFLKQHRHRKSLAYGAGAGLGGIAEGLFVDDVEEVGSFGDLLGGPTGLDREKDTPEAEILNRLKFGIEEQPLLDYRSSR
ncbi:MAG: hypothetical protein CM15mV77_030 [uncultured marine virus]|nr:MAG: hypothetical protein CM15mV77_030 [uncultured marine virus]